VIRCSRPSLFVGRCESRIANRQSPLIFPHGDLNESASCDGSASGWASSGGTFDIERFAPRWAISRDRWPTPDSGSDPTGAREIVQRVKTLKIVIDPYDRLSAQMQSATELDEMLQAEPDPAMASEVDQLVRTIREELDAFELRSLLAGKDDFRDAQVEISAGRRGTEAQDWAQMLMRMYTRWAERRGFTVEMLDVSEGEEAGIKGAIMEIHGSYAYGFLLPEAGSTAWCGSLPSMPMRGVIRASRRCSSIPSSTRRSTSRSATTI